jgi:signal peptidase I
MLTDNELDASIAPRTAESTSEPVASEPVVEAPEPPADRRRLLWRAFAELLHDASIAVVFCFFLITFVAQAFRVQGPSMMPVLEDGERIVVNKLIYRFWHIHRGDVVVFWYPHDPSVSYIKRVVALPGDLIEMRAGKVYVNDQLVPEPYLKREFLDDSNLPPTRVKSGFYFVLGDHRNMSNDSRAWGEVPEKYIYGKAFFRFWPISKISAIR